MSLLHYYDAAPGADVTAPIATITAGPTRVRMSRQATVDASEITWTVDETYQAYQLRVVTNTTDDVTMGTQIESGGGGAAGTPVVSTITDDELVAASPADGNKLIKLFVQDSAGNWSSNA